MQLHSFKFMSWCIVHNVVRYVFYSKFWFHALVTTTSRYSNSFYAFVLRYLLIRESVVSLVKNKERLKFSLYPYYKLHKLQLRKYWRKQQHFFHTALGQSVIIISMQIEPDKKGWRNKLGKIQLKFSRRYKTLKFMDMNGHCDN